MKVRQYPARFIPDKKAGDFVVTSPDVPEAITQGETEKSPDFPTPSSPKRGMRLVQVSTECEVKFRL